MNKTIVFISKDAYWQKYRNDVLTKFTFYYDVNIFILTTHKLKNYIKPNDNLKYLVLGSGNKFFDLFVFPLRVINFILFQKPDQILVHGHISEPADILALLLGKIMKIGSTIWTHGYYCGKSSFLSRRIRDLLLVIYCKLSDSVIAFSKRGYENLISYSIDSRKISIAPNTLDTDDILKNKEKILKNLDRNELLKKYNVGSESKVILYCGRFSKRKNLHLLIKAFNVLKQNKDVYLFLVGNGETYEQNVNLANIYNNSRVVFFSSVYEKEILAKIFSLAHIFVIPSWAGLSIIEAFCYGLPVITDNSKYHPPEIEYLKEGFNGLFYEENNYMDLAVKINNLLDNEEMMKNLSENALLTIKNKANIQLMLKGFSKGLNINEKI